MCSATSKRRYKVLGLVAVLGWLAKLPNYNQPGDSRVSNLEVSNSNSRVIPVFVPQDFSSVDWTRVKVFTLFGFTFTGVWQYCLFVKICPRVCPGAEAFVAKPWREKLRDKQGLKELFIQNFAENGFNHPLVYFPLFYTIQEFMNKGWEDGRLRNGLSKYVENAHSDLPAIWTMWVPLQLINFGFSPMWFRIPFIATGSALWTGYVSFFRGSSEEKGLPSTDGSPPVCFANKAEEKEETGNGKPMRLQRYLTKIAK